MRLIRHLAVRLSIAAVTLLGVTALIFAAMRFIPGGFEDLILGPFATERARELVRARFGLDQPLVVQYLKWLWASLNGDFGSSMITQQPVATEILRRIGPTSELALMALLMAVVIGLPLGIATAVAGNRGPRSIFANAVVGTGLVVPDFVLGALLVYLFSRWQLGLTVGGYVPLADDPWTNLRSMVLPAFTLGLFGTALLTRTASYATREVLVQPHVTAAVARGASPGEIIRLHVLRNTAIPILTSATVFFAYLLGGTVVVEQLFSVPGLGNYIITALANRDYAVVQAGALLGAFFFIALNTLADVAYAVLDPRIGDVRR